jgi:hypothetical protein
MSKTLTELLRERLQLAHNHKYFVFDGWHADLTEAGKEHAQFFIARPGQLSDKKG